MSVLLILFGLVSIVWIVSRGWQSWRDTVIRRSWPRWLTILVIVLIALNWAWSIWKGV